MLVDFDSLKNQELYLHSLLVRATGYDSGIHQVDLTDTNILPEFKFRLEEWVATDMPGVEPLPAEGNFDMAAYEKQQFQRATDEARGLLRLQQFQKEQGLRDCKENADAIRDWLDANCKGYVSQDMIDAAVLNLGPRGKNALLWDQKTIESPPAPEPTEVLEMLPNGEKQLPLDVAPTNRASKEQVKDWLARTRKATGKYLRPQGGFGSRF